MGVIDGSLNNLDILKDVTMLSTNINSDKVTADNNNANTRTAGSENTVALDTDDE